jgi:phage major head subunit gpT-like protein
MESRGNWGGLVAGVGLEFAEVFDQTQEVYTPGNSALLMQKTGAGAQKNVTSKSNIGRLDAVEEGDDISAGRRHKGYETQVVYTKYAKSVSVTKEQMEDRDFEAELDEMRDLSVAANFSQDESALQIFNGGFATTKRVNGYDITQMNDGVPTFSTVHPTTVPGGSTQSNASSTGITLTEANLETARVAMTLQQTDNGTPLSLLGTATLAVPMNLEKEAQVITMSERVSGSENNDINTYKGTINVVSSQFLDAANSGSDTAWFLVVPGRTKFVHEVRQATEFAMDSNILNQVATFTSTARWADYVADWRRSWGSKGDSQAYSS